jgi:subtilisin family serine protease
MAGWRRLLLAVIAAWFSTAGVAWAADDTERQVLVMLRLAPEHFRAGSSYAGGYGDGASRQARQRIAERLAREHGLARVTDWPMPLIGVDCFVLQAPEGRNTAEVAADLARDAAVAWSEPMQSYRAQGAPNDPMFALQPAAHDWRLAELRGVATGRGVRVAVIDSAVDPAHPDLAGQVAARADFVIGHPAVAEAHGTGVAGVIAAQADNRLGIAGIAPGARLMALRACWQRAPADTTCDTLSLAKALSFAIERKAQVINMSLGGPPNVLLGRLIDVALERDAVVVAAVDPTLAGGGFPASHRGVTAVASAPGGAAGAISAPGRDIPTTQPGGGFGLVSGSSYAAAHVSGLYALLRERDPRATLLAEAGGAVDACATLRACGGRTPLAARAAPPAR